MRIAKITLTIITAVALLSFISCASANKETKKNWNEKEEKRIIEIARDIVKEKEEEFWAEGAFIEVYSYEKNVWLVVAWGPYPHNTLGDFRWMLILNDGTIKEYRIGTPEDQDKLKDLRKENPS